MVRTQLYLDEAMHERLKRLAARQGRSLSDLVREAVDRCYGPGEANRRLATLRAVAGLWREREDLGETQTWVRQLRTGSRERPAH
jgi:hypothetical protein